MSVSGMNDEYVSPVGQWANPTPVKGENFGVGYMCSQIGSANSPSARVTATSNQDMYKVPDSPRLSSQSAKLRDIPRRILDALQNLVGSNKSRGSAGSGSSPLASGQANTVKLSLSHANKANGSPQPLFNQRGSSISSLQAASGSTLSSTNGITTTSHKSTSLDDREMPTTNGAPSITDGNSNKQTLKADEQPSQSIDKSEAEKAQELIKALNKNRTFSTAKQPTQSTALARKLIRDHMHGTPIKKAPSRVNKNKMHVPRPRLLKLIVEETRFKAPRPALVSTSRASAVVREEALLNMRAIANDTKGGDKRFHLGKELLNVRDSVSSCASQSGLLTTDGYLDVEIAKDQLLVDISSTGPITSIDELIAGLLAKDDQCAITVKEAQDYLNAMPAGQMRAFIGDRHLFMPKVQPQPPEVSII